jgi:hypothetical protein
VVVLGCWLSVIAGGYAERPILCRGCDKGRPPPPAVRLEQPWATSG